jgi:hypothetical protein
MGKMIYIPMFIVLFSLSACVQALPVTPMPTPSGGIEGLVKEGPMCPGPVAIGDMKCKDQPYQATISILDVNHNSISQFQTGVDGLFKIPLAAGTYILHPESNKALPHAADQSVIVIASQYTQVVIAYDTGMR